MLNELTFPTISPFVPGGPSAPTGPGGPCQRNVTYNVIGSIQQFMNKTSRHG